MLSYFKKNDMIIGIHYDLENRMSDFCLRYEKILSYNNIDFKRLSIDDLDFWESVKEVDFFIFRWWHTYDSTQLAHTIIPIIEKHYHKPTFPSLKTCWHFDDKVKQYFLLKTYEYPFVESYIFWSKNIALAWLKEVKLPIVFKLKNGAGSSNVVLINSKRKARKLIQLCFGKGISSIDTSLTKLITFKRIIGTILRDFKLLKGNQLNAIQTQKGYVLFQKYLSDNPFDIRITVIGQRAFAFRRFNRDNDFRASGSGRIDYDKDSIDKRAVEIAFDISNNLGFQSMAYDFLYNEHSELEICEISYTFSDIAINNCPGYWDINGNWNSGHYWPQYFQLIDLLNISELKQPAAEAMMSL